MPTDLELDILPQPDDDTCGPTCLHALYRFYGDEIALPDVAAQTQRLENRGTLAVFLASHALRRGYKATIYTYNLQVFDPTWFRVPGTDFEEKLKAQIDAVQKPRLQVSSRAYLEYLKLGGKLEFQDLTPELIGGFLSRGRPILTGLSATYLYRSAREYGPKDDYDDIRGKPSGHFVVLCGYQSKHRQVTVADPMYPNPQFAALKYNISIDRVIGAILLGILTYDANLLIIEPDGLAQNQPAARSFQASQSGAKAASSSNPAEKKQPRQRAASTREDQRPPKSKVSKNSPSPRPTEPKAAVRATKKSRPER